MKTRIMLAAIMLAMLSAGTVYSDEAVADEAGANEAGANEAGAIPTGDAGRARLDAIVADAQTPLAGVVMGIWRGQTPLFVAASGCASFTHGPGGQQICARPLTVNTHFRAASISKMAVGLAVLQLADDGRLDLDEDASAYLGWSLRHPAFPDRAISVRALLNHTSGLRDPEAYWAVAPESLEARIAGDRAFFAPEAEAQTPYFSYANINYGLLGGIVERVTGQRFDGAMHDLVLGPLGLSGGFNWFGADPAVRAAGASLHRRENDIWAVSTDGADILSSTAPHFLARADLDRDAYLAQYTPGENASLFSPQGGLRTDIDDLARLARAAYARATRNDLRYWRHDESQRNGATWDGYFKTYGPGIQILAADQTPFDKPLIGHGGEAYGLLSGAFAMAPDDSDGEPIIVTYAITGTPRAFAAGQYTGFFDLEDPVIALAHDIVTAAITAPPVHDDHAAGDHDDDPRPYDETRNAMADVDAALARSRETGRHALLVLGANWCHDSRGLARNFNDPRLASLIHENYVRVYVDVGRRDRNISVAERFGVDEIRGTPTVIIVSPAGEVINADTVHDWRTAASVPFDETYDYFAEFARRRPLQ